MSRILFDAFDGGTTASVAADLTAELSAAAQVTEAITANVAAAFGSELTAAAVADVASPATAASIEADLTSELQAAASARSNIYFIPPAPGDPRVAVVTHSH